MRAIGFIAIAVFVMGLCSPTARAQSSSDDFWNPFKWLDPAAPRQSQPPVDRANLERGPTPKLRSGPVESSDLPPVLLPDRSGLPLDLWRGIELVEFEQLLAGLEFPPRSPALHDLWRRILTSSASPPGGASNSARFAVLRLEALYRSGLLREMSDVEQRGTTPNVDVQVLLARRDIGLGAREQGCRSIRSLGTPSTELRERLKGKVQLLMGYCAAVAGDAAAAGLAANLAREEGAEPGVALRVLDSVSMGAKKHPALPARVSLLEYRFLELVGPVGEAQVLEGAEPALLVALAQAPTSDLHMRTAAAEAALRVNALTAEGAAEIYRNQPLPSKRVTPGEVADAVVRRALLYRAVEATQAPDLKAQLMRALLEDARRTGIHLQTARMIAPLVTQLWPSPDSAILAEPVVEVALAAGEYELARRWAETAADLQHWVALIDLADDQPGRSRIQGLRYADQLATQGRLTGDALHRLATVLDALDINVPMGIWEAAGRAPQPTSGYLPETGVLADLAQSAKRKDTGRTALLAIQALGPNGADGAHILALGDTVRALKRAGLEREARHLAVEALFAAWPRARGT